MALLEKSDPPHGVDRRLRAVNPEAHAGAADVLNLRFLLRALLAVVVQRFDFGLAGDAMAGKAAAVGMRLLS